MADFLLTLGLPFLGLLLFGLVMWLLDLPSGIRTNTYPCRGCGVKVKDAIYCPACASKRALKRKGSDE